MKKAFLAEVTYPFRGWEVIETESERSCFIFRARDGETEEEAKKRISEYLKELGPRLSLE